MQIVPLILHAPQFRDFMVKRAINIRNIKKPLCLSGKGATAAFWKWPILGKINMENTDRDYQQNNSVLFLGGIFYFEIVEPS